MRNGLRSQESRSFGSASHAGHIGCSGPAGRRRPLTLHGQPQPWLLAAHADLHNLRARPGVLARTDLDMGPTQGGDRRPSAGRGAAGRRRPGYRRARPRRGTYPDAAGNIDRLRGRSCREPPDRCSDRRTDAALRLPCAFNPATHARAAPASGARRSSPWARWRPGSPVVCLARRLAVAECRGSARIGCWSGSGTRVMSLTPGSGGNRAGWCGRGRARAQGPLRTSH